MGRSWIRSVSTSVLVTGALLGACSSSKNGPSIVCEMDPMDPVCSCHVRETDNGVDCHTKQFAEKQSLKDPVAMDSCCADESWGSKEGISCVCEQWKCLLGDQPTLPADKRTCNCAYTSEFNHNNFSSFSHSVDKCDPFPNSVCCSSSISCHCDEGATSCQSSEVVVPSCQTTGNPCGEGAKSVDSCRQST